MLTIFLTIPFLGAIYMSINATYPLSLSQNIMSLNSKTPHTTKNNSKYAVLKISVSLLLISFVLFTFLDISINEFQFVEECHEITSLNLYIGLDPLSIFFLLLTTIIIPISFLSNSTSIKNNLKLFFVCILLLEGLLLLVFAILDSLFYYVFFESILPPLFVFIGSYGSENRTRASFYLFLYTLLGSLFLLLSILSMSCITGLTDLDSLFKITFDYLTQIIVFCGIFIAFAVKTPTVFLNTWLLKAHVESPISGSIILAAIVLKLSLYGILRLILPLLPKASLAYTFIIYLIGLITILFASISTLRTVDVKELIAYSSVCHAAVYLMSVFSNTIQGIEGGISLGLAHGFVSSGLFICAGAVLYDRSITRLITHYRGMAQIMPLFSLLFFILCLGNCSAPLTLNFVGEFLSLYGAFERLPLLGVLASSSIIFSAAYTIYMFNRIAFAGSFSKFFKVNISDLNKREFYILLTLVLFTLVLGVYPAPVLDGLHYSVTALIYSFTEDGFTLLIMPFFIPKKIRYFKVKFWKSVLWIFNSPPKPNSFVTRPSYNMIPGHYFTIAVPYVFSVFFGYCMAIAFMSVVEFGGIYNEGVLLTPTEEISDLDFWKFLFDMEALQDHAIYRHREQPSDVDHRYTQFLINRLYNFRSVYEARNPDNLFNYDVVIGLLAQLDLHEEGTRSAAELDEQLPNIAHHINTGGIEYNIYQEINQRMRDLTDAAGGVHHVNLRLNRTLLWASNPLRNLGDLGTGPGQVEPMWLYEHFVREKL